MWCRGYCDQCTKICVTVAWHVYRICNVIELCLTRFMTDGLATFFKHMQEVDNLALLLLTEDDYTKECCSSTCIFSSSPFLPRSVSSFTHWSAGTFNCPLCGRIWRFKCRQVRQIKPAQLAFGRTIKISLFTYLFPLDCDVAVNTVWTTVHTVIAYKYCINLARTELRTEYSASADTYYRCVVIIGKYKTAAISKML